MYAYMFAPVSLPNVRPILTQLRTQVPHYLVVRGKKALIQYLYLRAERGKVSKLHVTNRPIYILGDFDKTWYAWLSSTDLKYYTGKYALNHSLRTRWGSLQTPCKKYAG
ncbi:hypothetical protein AVEN_117782-1 [Araneus ventricosus]|uniref:Uncharacterized protein n=1 Tax=Araneus ventricosus TaxID=182803 RepID=A0A4Y2B780_ARAVE|nr:hypothetical protein AVEN_117782-1 [Araneus ventricosus]